MARRSGSAVVSVIVVLLLLATPAGSSIRSSPTRDWAYAVALQKDGKIVVAGCSACQSFGARRVALALARYTPRGRLDGSFGRGGKLVLPGFGYEAKLAIQPDGHIVAAGEAADQARAGTTQRGELVALTRSGSLETSFGRGGNVETASTLEAVMIQPDGKIVTGGLGLTRYTRRGTLDATFGRSGMVQRAGNRRVNPIAVVLQRRGRIVTVIGGGLLMRFNADGSVDSSFGKRSGTLVDLDLDAIAVEPDGEIVAAGSYGSSEFKLARYSADGLLDTTFGRDGQALTHLCGTIYGDAIAIQEDGKIVAVVAACEDFAVARYNTDGSLDTTFGRGGIARTHFNAAPSHGSSSSWAQAVAIQRDGKIVVAGLGNGYDFALARYTTRGRLDLTFGRGGKMLTDFGSG